VSQLAQRAMRADASHRPDDFKLTNLAGAPLVICVEVVWAAILPTVEPQRELRGARDAQRDAASDIFRRVEIELAADVACNGRCRTRERGSRSAEGARGGRRARLFAMDASKLAFAICPSRERCIRDRLRARASSSRIAVPRPSTSTCPSIPLIGSSASAVTPKRCRAAEGVDVLTSHSRIGKRWLGHDPHRLPGKNLRVRNRRIGERIEH
jgi:hypothetical protein